MGEKYCRNSIIAAILALTAYIICLIADIRFLVKWSRYGELSLAFVPFIPLMLVHLIFLILSIIWYKNRNKMKEADFEGKKRNSPAGSLAGLFIMVLVAVGAFYIANAMVEYVYNSRNGRGDMTLEDFKAKASMTVNSDDLNNGVWDSSITNTPEGQDLSPQLSFDKVEGASYYVIYMVDESANNWVHWYAEVPEPGLDHGLNAGKYIGPYPPEGSGDHIYAVYVYALADKPGVKYDGEYPEFDEPWLGAESLWSGVLNIKDSIQRPTLYGNVISYGYIEGTYSR